METGSSGRERRETLERDENPCDVTERPLSAQVGRLNPRLSTEYTDTWRGSRGRVRCIWTGRANPIIYSSLFDLPIDRYFRAKDTAKGTANLDETKKISPRFLLRGTTCDSASADRYSSRARGPAIDRSRGDFLPSRADARNVNPPLCLQYKRYHKVVRGQ